MRIMTFGAAATILFAIACSDSSPTQASKTDWSGAVIKVAAENPNAHGELRGVVLDSTDYLDPAKATPIPGATVVLNLRVTMPPGSGGLDTAWTTVQKVGEVVTDANGRFLVTDIPDGDYSLVATPADGSMYYGNSTWAFVSSGTAAKDAVIYLPRKLDTLPGDSLPPTPPGPPIDPPVDSM
jgi:hypothetical protein